jgi:hypothetical protein
MNQTPSALARQIRARAQKLGLKDSVAISAAIGIHPLTLDRILKGMTPRMRIIGMVNEFLSGAAECSPQTLALKKSTPAAVLTGQLTIGQLRRCRNEVQCFVAETNRRVARLAVALKVVADVMQDLVPASERLSQALDAVLSDPTVAELSMADKATREAVRLFMEERELAGSHRRGRPTTRGRARPITRTEARLRKTGPRRRHHREP